MKLSLSLCGLFLFLGSAAARADAAIPTFTCVKDANGDQLNVSDIVGHFQGFLYSIAPAPGEPPMGGQLSRTRMDPTFGVELKGKDITISVPAVEEPTHPQLPLRVTYRIHAEPQVTVDCTRGPSFERLFQR